MYLQFLSWLVYTLSEKCTVPGLVQVLRESLAPEHFSFVSKLCGCDQFLSGGFPGEEKSRCV